MSAYSKCEARTGASVEHCWHSTGVQLCTYPPKTEDMCCFCGAKKYTPVFYIPPQSNDVHGPYYQLTTTTIDTADTMQGDRNALFIENPIHLDSIP